MEKGKNCERRSPLQDLNLLIPMNKPNAKKGLNVSSSSSRNKRPDFSSKSASNAPHYAAVASKAALPRKSILRKSNKIQPLRPSEGRSRSKCAKPISKNAQRSKLYVFDVDSGHNNLKKKSKEIQTKMKNLQLACSGIEEIGGGLFDYGFSLKVDDLGAPTVKTPPAEASVSPDFQCPSDHNKIVAQSTEPLICYGAGHVLSGVTDKRKCRRRGSLRGCEKVNLFQGEPNEIDDPQDSLIPLLSEGSVTWHDDQGTDSSNMLDKCIIRNDNASATLDLSSSNARDSVWDDIISFRASVSIGNAVRGKKTGIITHSPGEFQEFLGPWNSEMVKSLLAASPVSSFRGEGVIQDDSEFSIGSLSSGNVIQTPNSGSGSKLSVGWSTVEVEQINLFQSKNDSISEIISQENVDCVSSWISDCTTENLALSRMRISWRDGIYGSRDLEVDEFDCCRGLSDEEIISDQIHDPQLTTSTSPKVMDDKESNLGAKGDIKRPHSRIASGENEGTSSIGNDDNDLLPPVVLEYEPSVSARGKEKLDLHRPNTCAESIFTSRGGQLLNSGDSDWSCFHDITCLRSNSYK